MKLMRPKNTSKRQQMVFGRFTKQLGVDSSFSADLRNAGQKIDAVIKSCSQGSLYALLSAILTEDRSFSMPPHFAENMVPNRDGVGLPKLSGISAELFARLRGPGVSGPLSRECAKLQAYLPAISECLEKRLLPDYKPAYDAVLFLIYRPIYTHKNQPFTHTIHVWHIYPHLAQLSMVNYYR